MKKILTLICCTVILAATSCKKETIIGPGATTVFTSTTGWSFDSTIGNNGAYTSDIPMPEIDNYYDNHGAVLVYLDDSGTYEQLPDVFDGITYRFVYTKGHVYIDAQNADGSKLTVAPPKLNVKIVLVQ
ncbi:hypothetical protein [Mucilaginibacter sp. OK283]|jgi:hypothetical protein|uniref:hypothetical protein n=1 Tax=Mucilaginibacter sp. OK283 TaxID=1881049 RepID=UPI0008D6EC97|nr:hypothetical protein [Mucilaginibacter sp. OK283]SEP28961.1 hypothetical protein SAMN05428947_1108 [Mucilaginibacter sp. OK283]